MIFSLRKHRDDESEVTLDRATRIYGRLVDLVREHEQTCPVCDPEAFLACPEMIRLFEMELRWAFRLSTLRSAERRRAS